MIKCCKGPIIDHYRPFNKIKKKQFSTLYTLRKTSKCSEFKLIFVTTVHCKQWNIACIYIEKCILILLRIIIILQLPRIWRDLWCQKHLWHWVLISATSIKIWRISTFTSLGILVDPLGNQRSYSLWFANGRFQSVLRVSVFQGLLLLNFRVKSHVFEKCSEFYLVLSIFYLLYTKTLQVWIPKVKLFLKSFQIQKNYRYGKVKTNLHVPANIYICSFC